MTAPPLLADATAVMDETIDVRRRIHARPEIGLDLPDTQTLVAERLSRMGLDSRPGTSCSSLVAMVEGETEGPTTLLRADMDALEMPEDTGLDYRSRIGGRMHACGHDAHVAMLLGATKVLLQHRSALKGRVAVIFQPGEEGHGGAKLMLEEGLLRTYGPVERAFAVHISSNLSSGHIATRPGPMMASADEFRITVTGRGGHASMPHHAADPIPVACEMVTSIQAMVTRRVPVSDPAVVTVSTIHAGTAENVIPEQVVMTGTVRALSDESRYVVLAGLADVVEHVAAAHGCSAVLEMLPGNYPVTVNDAAMAQRTLELATDLVGPDRVSTLPSPIMGAEDWSFVLQAVPGSMAFLGAAPAGVERPAPNHSNRFVIDEDAMATGIALYAAVALDATPLDAAVRWGS